MRGMLLCMVGLVSWIYLVSMMSSLETLYCDRCKRSFQPTIHDQRLLDDQADNTVIDLPYVRRYRSHVSICSVGSTVIGRTVTPQDHRISETGIMYLPCALCGSEMPWTRSAPGAINVIKVTWLAKRNGDAVFTGKPNASGFLEDVSYAGRSRETYYKAAGTIQICEVCYAPFATRPGVTLDLDSVRR
jgi:hypothetical protein